MKATWPASEKHEPITTADGETALSVARAVRPDLILEKHLPAPGRRGTEIVARTGDSLADRRA